GQLELAFFFPEPTPLRFTIHEIRATIVIERPSRGAYDHPQTSYLTRIDAPTYKARVFHRERSAVSQRKGQAPAARRLTRAAAIFLGCALSFLAQVSPTGAAAPSGARITDDLYGT